MKIELFKRKILNTVAVWISYIKLIPDWFRLNNNSIAIDCGANVGHIAKMLASTGATVIAFEPDPIAFEQLKNRCKNKKNITCINKGVWDRNAILDLYLHKSSNGVESEFSVSSSIVAAKKNIDIAKKHPIEVIDLISFIQQLNRKIDLIKLDVEGAEIEILRKILISECWPLFSRMYVETHETKIPTQANDIKQIRQQLKEKSIKNIKLNWM